MDYKFELNAKSYFGIPDNLPSALNFGGNEDPSKTYFEKNGNSKPLVEGVRLAKQRGRSY
jgi:hypothetical protein